MLRTDHTISVMLTGNSKSAILAILGLFVAGAAVLSMVDEQEGMRAAAAAMLEAAVELHPGEGDFHMDALKKSAPEVSAELVGTSAEKKFALYQTCSPYLEPDGITKAVQSRVAAGATPR